MKSKLSTAKKSKTTTFSRIFHPKIDNFLGKLKLNFWTKNEDFEQCEVCTSFFNVDWMVDRHLQLSYMMVDVVGQHPPKMEKDPHWDVCIPEELPYTVASLPFRTPPAQTSAELLSIPIKEQQPIYPQYLEPNDPKPLNNSTWRLNLAISNLMTPMVKRRQRSRKVSSISTYSMPFPESNAARSRRKVMRNPTSSSLSPYFARRNNLELMRARTPSIESIIGGGGQMSCTPTESRSRKASAKSFCQLKPVLEGIKLTSRRPPLVVSILFFFF